ncbi:hypothetical protein TGMAS_234310B, partial [Toxoplasma gondii MAS]
ARRRFLCLLVSSLFSVRISSSFCERLLPVCHLLAFLSARASFLPQLGSMRLSTANPNRDRRAIEKTGVVELSRREREELERQRRQRIYEPGGGPTAARGGRAPACSERRRVALWRPPRSASPRLLQKKWIGMGRVSRAQADGVCTPKQLLAGMLS